MNRVRLTFAVLLVISMAWFILGCGGGGGDTTQTTNATGGSAPTRVQVSVDWAARSRSLEGPSSAQSFALKLIDPATNASDLTFAGNRGPELAAHTQNYVTEDLAVPGHYQLIADFFADRDALGSKVGTVTVSVKLLSNGSLAKPDGTMLGTIATVGTVASVSLDPAQAMIVGQSGSLSFTAKDSAGSTLVLSPGSAQFSVIDGDQFIRVTADGTVNAVAAGTATVRVTVDGISGTGAVIVNNPAGPTVRILNVQATEIVYDSVRDLIYASVPASAGINPNKVVAVRPSDGEVVKSMYVGSEPNLLAISDDCSTLYVALDGAASIRSIDTATFTANPPFPVQAGSNNKVEDMAVRPHHPDTVAASGYNTGVSPRGTGIRLYQNGVMKPQIGGGNVLTFDDSGNKLYSHTSEISSFDVTEWNVTDNGFSFVKSTGGMVSMFNQRIEYAHGWLFTTQYNVFDATTFQQVGNFPFATFLPRILPDRVRPYMYSLSQGGTTVYFQAFRNSDFSRAMIMEITLPSGGTGRLIKLTDSSFAFATQNGKIYVLEGIDLP